MFAKITDIVNKARAFGKRSVLIKNCFMWPLMRLHKHIEVKPYRKLNKSPLLYGELCKQACMRVIRIMHPHNTFTLLIDF